MSDSNIYLPIHPEKDFLEIEENSIKELTDTNKEYVDLIRQLSDMDEKYPFLVELIKGTNPISLTEEQCDIFREMLELSSSASRMERIHLYYKGHRDSLTYLKKNNII